jgi:hypothetical protein
LKNNAAVLSFYTFLKEGTRTTIIAHEQEKAGGEKPLFARVKKCFAASTGMGFGNIFSLFLQRCGEERLFL